MAFAANTTKPSTEEEDTLQSSIKKLDPPVNVDPLYPSLHGCVPLNCPINRTTFFLPRNLGTSPI